MKGVVIPLILYMKEYFFYMKNEFIDEKRMIQKGIKTEDKRYSPKSKT